MICCPSAKVIKSDTTGFLPVGGLHEGKLCDTLQAMAPTNVDTVHQTSLLPIESNLDRLGLLSSTHDHRSQQPRGQIPLRLDLMNKPKFLKAGNCNTKVHDGGGLELVKPGLSSSRPPSCRNKENWKTEVHCGGGLELVEPAHETAFSRPKPCVSLKIAP